MGIPQSLTEAWRRRRESMTGRSKPTYIAYPDMNIPPEVRFFVEARDVKGRLIREYIDLEGYSVHQLNWQKGATRGGVLVRDWFIGRMLQCMIRLNERLEETKARREFDYPPEVKEKFQ